VQQSQTYLEQALDRAAQIATGRDDVTARPSQRSLSASILSAMEHGQHVAAEAPTGVGKSLGCLVPAAIRAAVDGERSVISTETLAL
jgi:ATP-dependent DNA helicase DinG